MDSPVFACRGQEKSSMTLNKERTRKRREKGAGGFRENVWDAPLVLAWTGRGDCGGKGSEKQDFILARIKFCFLIL